MDGGIDVDINYRMDEVGKVWGRIDIDHLE